MMTALIIITGLLVILWVIIPIALIVYVKQVNYNQFPNYKKKIPKKLRRKWEKRLAKSILAEYLAFILAPMAAFFIVKEYRTDRVKRLGGGQIRMKREYLKPLFRWMQSHDNAVDEWYWGKFAREGEYGYDWTPEQYKASKWKRYYSRVKWIHRNTAYGYLNATLGVPKEVRNVVFEEGKDKQKGGYELAEVGEHSFFYEWQEDLGGGEYKRVNWGWKDHRSAEPIDGVVYSTFANKFIDFNASKYK